jgi:inosose dehydratase
MRSTFRSSRSGTWAPRIGANPIGWINDDFHDLGESTPLDTCLAEIRRAGFTGTELGRKYPRDAATLGATLRAHALRLVSGWHSTYLLERSVADETAELDRHLDLLGALGTDIAIVAECSRRVYHDGASPLAFTRNGDALATPDWDRLCAGLEELAVHAAQRGMRLAYHPHMGTVVQTVAETGRLMAGTSRLGLLLDTGHCAFAGGDPVAVLAQHGPRVVHVHLKNVRWNVVEAARRSHWSFERAVRAGVFTVPGDGGLDFAPVLARLRALEYAGWLVVEAEQDPAVAPPFEYAVRARAYLRAVAGV